LSLSSDPCHDPAPRTHHRGLTRGLLPLALLLFLLLFLVANLAWMSKDHVPRDGDEEGHVGAAELLMEAWTRPLEGIRASLWGDFGEYPPLHAGITGLWWRLAGRGDPGRPAVRVVNLAFPMLTALGVAFLVRRLGPLPALGGLVATLALGLVTGLGRHFMPENASMAAVTWTLAALEEARRRPSPLRLGLVGLLAGLAFLAKQTSLVALVPLLAMRLPCRWTSLLVPSIAALPVLPWLLPRLAEQARYGLVSAGSFEGAGLLRSVTFYPWALFWVAAGPFLGIVVLLSLSRRGLGREDAEALALRRVGLLWLLGSMALLVLLPRKDPRLLSPALPAVGLLVAVGLAGLPGWRHVHGALLLGALGWVTLASIRPLPVPRSAEVFDARCPQRWLRPPNPEDLGISEVVEALRTAPPGPILVVDPPEIPCEIQTTHDWGAHLAPALRRAGQDREVLLEGSLERPAVVVSWRAPEPGVEGRAIRVEALGGSVWVSP
jgi:hypothetical protein